MKRPGHRLTLIALVAIPLFSVHYASARITVACAANMRYAMEELQDSFATTGDSIQAVYGASGNLLTQIKNGAPFDLFLSADEACPESLWNAGGAVSPPAVYTYGRLILWTTKAVSLQAGLSALLDSAVKTIAIPDPGIAPYGKAAVAALSKAGLYSRIRSRLVYGENIGQAAQYIATGAVDAGFNAEAIVVAGPMKGKGTWIAIDSALYPPIAQAAVLCRFGKDHHFREAKRFMALLYSANGRALLARYGYGTP